MPALIGFTIMVLFWAPLGDGMGHGLGAIICAADGLVCDAPRSAAVSGY